MQYSQKLFTPEELKHYPDPFGFTPNYKAIIYLVVEAIEEKSVIGRVVAGVYPTDSIWRSGQWLFGENKLRSLWIDRIDVRDQYQRKDIGKELMKRVELYLRVLDKPSDSKRNFYLLAIHDVIPFYLTQGWDIIFTDDHDEDEDYPSVFHSEHAVWMSKPLDIQLDREERYFDLLKDEEIVEEMIRDRIPGLSSLNNRIYEAFVTYTDECHPFDVLGWFSYYGSLEEIKGLYERIKNAISKVNYIENDTPNVKLHPKTMGMNPEGSLILEWAKKTFGDGAIVP